MLRFVSERDPQLVFRLFQFGLLGLGEISAAPVDVEIQHRHSGLKRRPFAAHALFCGAFERMCDSLRIALFEDAGLKIERVAALHYSGRPFALWHERFLPGYRGTK